MIDTLKASRRRGRWVNPTASVMCWIAAASCAAQALLALEPLDYVAILVNAMEGVGFIAMGAINWRVRW